MDAKKKANLIVIAALIVIALVIEIMGVIDGNGLVTDKILNGILVIGLLAGLVYLYTGSVKGSAKYYKVFMIIYAIELVYSVVAGICYSNALAAWGAADIIGLVLTAVSAVCIIVLAFGKDLGKKKSVLFALLNLILVCVNTLIGIFVFGNLASHYSIYIGNVILAVVTFLFVLNKYADKKARGRA